MNSGYSFGAMLGRLWARLGIVGQLGVISGAVYLASQCTVPRDGASTAPKVVPPLSAVDPAAEAAPAKAKLPASTLTADATLDCKATDKVSYKAEFVDSGNNSAVIVQFFQKTGPAVATRVVESCMQIIVSKHPSRDLLGSAWLNEKQISLAPGKENLVYFPSERKIRPFGLAEALAGLKKKEPNAEPPASAFDNFSGLTATTRELKALMRDPDSFSVTKYGQRNSDGTRCMIYRAANGFGGVNVGYAVLSAKRSVLDDPVFFKKMCSGL